jgi:hypothetical protein
MLSKQQLTSQLYSLTVHDHPHILDETVNDPKRLRCRRPGLVLGESVQPLKNRLDTILSEKFLYKFLCIPFSRGINTSTKADSLGRPCVICFVASARAESNSTIIFTTISVMAGAGGPSL